MDISVNDLMLILGEKEVQIRILQSQLQAVSAELDKLQPKTDAPVKE